MRAFIKKIVVPAAIIALVSLPLTTARSYGMTAQKSAGNAPQPIVPQQFTPVADADWSEGKPLVGREIECQNGKIKIFDCQNMSLLSFIPAKAIGDTTWGVTGIWGWTDSATGREFVLAAREGGTSFIEISDPLNPRYLGELPFYKDGEPSRWRDIKVYKNHAFIVSDNAGPHGIQVFDLTQLLGLKTAPTVFQETTHYDQVASVHDIALDTATGFAYAVGSNGGGETCGGGLHMVDVRDPAHPAFAGCYAEARTGMAGTGYIHDTQCTVYHGPDKQYQGREICFNSAETAVSIADVTDKKQPKTIGIANYPNVAYAHQGWLTEDQRYFFLGDELDEEQNGGNTRTMVFDMKSLSDPVLVKEFLGPNAATDHNMYVRDRYMFQSNYQAGLRVLDVGDPANLKEVGYFDTTPGAEIPVGYGGSWSNYPYFKSGLIAVSTYKTETNNGVFILRHHPTGAR